MKRFWLCVVAAAFAAPALAQQTAPATMGTSPVVRDTWDWPEAMQKVADRFTGTEGVVIHFGDSITYANPYGQWARGGQGKTASDRAVLKWMHAGENNDLDGWYLAAYDVPNRGGSYTAVSGMRMDQALQGGFHGMPPMAEIIKKYNPQIVVLMLGSNDVSQNRPVAAYGADLAKAIELVLGNHTVLVLSTIPPMAGKQDRVERYNKTIVELARKHRLPLIDYYGEILSRRPGDTWMNTLISADGVHPTASNEGVTSASEPTAENLARSGFLLRGWLSVQKIKQVKSKVIDPAKKAAGGAGGA